MSTEYLIEFRKTTGARVIGWAVCGVCDWRVSMIDDTQDEVNKFLSYLLRDHALTLHGQRFSDKGDSAR